MLNVVLYEPEIPPNTGTIGRLCHSAGFRLHLIEPLGFAIDDRSLQRAGLDYWDELEPVLWPSLEACLAEASPTASVYYLTTKSDRSYWTARFEEGDYLVFGPETRGLPESLLRFHEEKCLTIPQERGRSLNLAVSVGIVAYEAVRQLHSQE
ncbi:MAG: tRNA (cytidine(34)-2'-O)-methyltransferase [Verrucomicrobiota bacterium]